MGNSISTMKQLIQDETDYNVLVTIFTDGLENASKEYNGELIKKMVDELKQKNWTFTYIGTDHDVEGFARSISIIQPHYIFSHFPFFFIYTGILKAQMASDVKTNSEYEAVHATILDYVEALYQVEPERIEASVDTSLRKVGYYYDLNEGAYRDNLEMT